MFRLQQEYVHPQLTIKNYVNGNDFLNICLRKMGGVILETTHPRLHRQVFENVDQAIAAVGKLGWKIAA